MLWLLCNQLGNLMVTNTVQVKEKTFTDPSKFLYSSVVVDSATWFAWLKEPDVRSFHYEGDAGKFTARKEERATSTNEYWYAYRKVQGKLRKVYLGAMEELTGDRLEQVAQEISQPSSEFYSSRKSYTTKKKDSGITAGDKNQSYPIENQLSWVTPNPEVEALQTELNKLRSQLVEAALDRKQLAALKVKKEQLEQQAVELRDHAQKVSCQLPALEDEIDLLRSQMEHFKNQPTAGRESVASQEIIKLLEQAITPKSKGGNYSANNATGLRLAVEQALKQLTAATAISIENSTFQDQSRSPQIISFPGSDRASNS